MAPFFAWERHHYVRLAAFACVAAFVTAEDNVFLNPASTLETFPRTLLAGLAKIGGDGGASPTVHVVGAAGREATVDWTDACKIVGGILLVGPQVFLDGPEKVEGNCVSKVQALYSAEALRDALVAAEAHLGSQHQRQAASPGPDSLAPSVEEGVVKAAQLEAPDMAIAFNSDMYTCPWRRTLAELLRLQNPVLVTTYDYFEVEALKRILDDPANTFSAESLRECDEITAGLYPNITPRPGGAMSEVPTVRWLWEGELNPHSMASSPNAYWLAFVGVPLSAGRSAPNEEL